MNLFTYLRALIRKDEGQDMIEYALLAALIAIVAVGAVTVAGDRVEILWNSVRDALPTS